ncbi:hypothetical protein DRO64_05845 [Candidatus Bathyarchaeota archaeon]|nr:MAG: hypothetical protein DRO64_05845 [Candidatus Bathyarchaeota archaeon]
MNSFTEDEIKIIVLDKLRKRGCWGGRYTPLDSLIRWLGKKIKRNGRRVRAAIRQLINDGYLILHKTGKTVSLNPTRSREIMKFIGGE